jgi:hypothetical protein
MKKVVCTFDIFKKDQIIYIVDSDSTDEKIFAGLTILDNLALALAGIAKDFSIDTIVIEGDPEYSIILKEDILQEANNNNFIVNIEVL